MATTGRRPPTANPAGEGNAVLLGYPHIEVAIRQALVHLLQSGSLGHSCRDAHNAAVFFRDINQRIGEDLGIGRGIASVFLDDARFVVKCAGTMPLGGVVLGELPALALFGDNLHDDRTFDVLDILEDIQHEGEIMPIKGAKELETQFLEDHSRFCCA